MVGVESKRGCRAVFREGGGGSISASTSTDDEINSKQLLQAHPLLVPSQETCIIRAVEFSRNFNGRYRQSGLEGTNVCAAVLIYRESFLDTRKKREQTGPGTVGYGWRSGGIRTALLLRRARQ